MAPNEEISLWWVKEGCRIMACSFLSLLLPLSFLLLARLSVARYFISVANDYSLLQPHNNSLLTTLILTALLFLASAGALAHVLTGGRAALVEISHRRRLYCAWVLLFVMQFCLVLGIQGITDDVEINSYTVGSLVLPRRVVLFVGLHESMVFWWGNVVKPVVYSTIYGFSRGEDVKWMEKLVKGVAFLNLWWRRLKDEAEALVVLPWVTAELKVDVVGVADVGGWLVYYLTVAIGVVRVAKGVAWVFTGIFTHRTKV